MKLTKIQRFAKGQECTLQTPGVCSRDPAQTVLCHLGGAGMAVKRSDYDGLHACAPCHDVMDMRVMVKDRTTEQEIARARHVTTQRLIDEGLL
jgi:hypothetical protein